MDSGDEGDGGEGAEAPEGDDEGEEGEEGDMGIWRSHYGGPWRRMRCGIAGRGGDHNKGQNSFPESEHSRPPN